MFRLIRWSLLCLIILSNSAWADEVLVSIKPLHAIVSRLTLGVGQPRQLLPDNSSPHHYSMRPSEVLLLRQSQLFIWFGPELETFLTRLVEKLPSQVASLSLASLDSLSLIDYRPRNWLELSESAAHSETTAEPSHGHHQDPHFWLDPLRVKALLPDLVARLSPLYPDQQPRLQQNAQAFALELDALDTEIRATLSAVSRKPFLVYHDSYQYFSLRYQLNERGSVVKEPQEPLSVRQLIQLTERVKTEHIGCIFEDVEYPGQKLQRLFGDVAGRIGQLDSLGLNQKPADDLYLQLMRQLAQDVKHCLE